MSQFIINAKWVTPEGSTAKGAMEVVEGRIRLHATSPCSQSDEVLFDGRSYFFWPGFIDTHVHFREPGASYKEGIDNASKAALAGGVTTVLDMPNNNPPTTTPARLEAKKELFRRKCRTNWGIHLHSTFPVTPGSEPIASAKVYMAKSSGLPAITDPEHLKAIFKAYPRVAIHAEDETAFIPTPKGMEKTKTHELHDIVRPRRAITLALEKIEGVLRSLPKEERPRVIICHASTRDEVEWLARMKNDHFDVWGETCPHYFLFTRDDTRKLGSMLKVNPPIREASDREAILEGLGNGTLDFLGTDHAPHAPIEKAHKTTAPSGIAGIERLASAAFLLVDRGHVTTKRLVELTCINASKCYGIEGRDGIRDGNRADLVAMETTPGCRQGGKVITRAGEHPYPDCDLTRRVEATFVNGTLAHLDGTFPSKGPTMEVIT